MGLIVDPASLIDVKEWLTEEFRIEPGIQQHSKNMSLHLANELKKTIYIL